MTCAALSGTGSSERTRIDAEPRDQEKNSCGRKSVAKYKVEKTTSTAPLDSSHRPML